MSDGESGSGSGGDWDDSDFEPDDIEVPAGTADGEDEDVTVEVRNPLSGRALFFSLALSYETAVSPHVSKWPVDLFRCPYLMSVPGGLGRMAHIHR
jgi:hypothetical protein